MDRKNIQEDALTAVPQWTEMAEKSGLDPLGMQSACVSLYQRLIPGISNVTLRLRYYGLYAWLCGRYSQDRRHTSMDEWQRYIRRAEALYALVALQADADVAGIAGSRWAKRVLREAADPIPFHIATDQEGDVPQYLKQRMGAYGAAYGSQLFETGVLQAAKKHKLPILDSLGTELAEAFAEAIGDAAEAFILIATLGVVQREQLATMASMTPGGIAAGRERDMYEKLLFVPDAAVDSRAAQRRKSLHLILHTNDTLGGMPDSDDVRWVAYAELAPDGTSLAATSEELTTHRFSWKVYHANDLLHLAYEALMKFALQTLAGHPAGLTTESLIRNVVGAVLGEWPEPPATWSELEAQTTLAENPWSASDETSEYALMQSVLSAGGPATQCTSDIAKDAITLLAVLSKRMTPTEAALVKVVDPKNNEFMQSLRTELHFIRSQQGSPLGQMLGRLIRHRILERHLWVAAQKLHFQKDYTFLIESQGGLLRTRKLDGPVLTTPRLTPAIGFLHDLELVSHTGVTAKGRTLLDAA